MREPESTEVLSLIGKRGIIVGSFPKKGLAAKDIDVVVSPKLNESGRNIVLQELIKRWPEHFESGIIGHVVINAWPLRVEVFDGVLPLKDKDKEKGQLTFAQARRRSRDFLAFGIVPVKAVVGE